MTFQTLRTDLRYTHIESTFSSVCVPVYCVCYYVTVTSYNLAYTSYRGQVQMKSDKLGSRVKSEEFKQNTITL